MKTYTYIYSARFFFYSSVFFPTNFLQKTYIQNQRFLVLNETLLIRIHFSGSGTFSPLLRFYFVLLFCWIELHVFATFLFFFSNQQLLFFCIGYFSYHFCFVNFHLHNGFIQTYMYTFSLINQTRKLLSFYSPLYKKKQYILYSIGLNLKTCTVTMQAFAFLLLLLLVFLPLNFGV